MSLNSKVAEKLRFLACRQVKKLKQRKLSEVTLLRESLELSTIAFA
jgi:hypothetical protein